MDNYVWWFVIGFGLVVAELLTGTFYLLVLAVAFGAAGVWRSLLRRWCCSLRRRPRSVLEERYGCASRASDNACATGRPAIASKTWTSVRRCELTNGRRTARRAQITEVQHGMSSSCRVKRQRAESSSFARSQPTA